jgi:hypothetical protein
LQDWQRVAVVAFAALLVVEAAKGAQPRLKVA